MAADRAGDDLFLIAVLCVGALALVGLLLALLLARLGGAPRMGRETEPPPDAQEVDARRLGERGTAG